MNRTGIGAVTFAVLVVLSSVVAAGVISVGPGDHLAMQSAGSNGQNGGQNTPEVLCASGLGYKVEGDELTTIENQGTLEFTIDGTEYEVNVTGTTTKDGGAETTGFSFTSDEPVAEVFVKGGPDAPAEYNVDGTDSANAPESDDGILSTPGDQEISFVVFCVPEDQPPEPPEPVDVTVDCVGEDGVITANNTNDVDVNVTIAPENGRERTVSVSAGTETSFDGLPDGNYTITTSVNGRELGSEVVTVDCDQPEPPERVPVDVTVDCVGEDGVITVNNTNDVPVTVRVTGPDGFDRTVTVAANTEVSAGGFADGEYSVTTSIDGRKLATATVTVDCDQPEPPEPPESVDVNVDCADGVATMRVANPNDVAVTVTVTGPDGYEVSGAVQPTSERTLADVPDGEYTVVTSVDGREIDSRTVTVDCDLPEEDPVDAYQVDLAFGEVIYDLGSDENAFYGRQGRLVQAVSFVEDGTYTDAFLRPDGTATASNDECAVEYGAITYDETTGTAQVQVSLAEDADCESVTMTLAGYELPEGTTEFQRSVADQQELVDHVTVTLERGDSQTLTVDLDD
ncbi:hypothetical protein [Halomarina litorea]|uniref:hypothetical protein n=1 Tax=Halomarina litorea TaxID=2961595 RepID=UPI0020C2C46D|nr:hypothetical protein [Halomarina sp. BCD28]